jgi:glycosyltransferase involved in cell wall biosynthesis
LDFVFIPLRKNNFNISSESINKYLECGLLKIPIMVDDMFPYNQLIVNQRNGYLYKNKENFISELESILKNPDLLKNVSEDCRKDVIKNYTYNSATMEVMNSIYI